jgi:hypothetical protein
VVPPVAVYQPAVRDGDRLFTSGQLPMKDGQLMTPASSAGLFGVGPSTVYRAIERQRFEARAGLAESTSKR